MSNAGQSKEKDESNGLLGAIIAIVLLALLARYGPSGVRARRCLADRDAKIAQGIRVGPEEQECPPPSLPGFPGF